MQHKADIGAVLGAAQGVQTAAASLKTELTNAGCPNEAAVAQSLIDGMASPVSALVTMFQALQDESGVAE
jgi:hypothetical protein